MCKDRIKNQCNTNSDINSDGQKRTDPAIRYGDITYPFNWVNITEHQYTGQYERARS